MPRVFISHSSQDRELVEREIISPLRARGVDTWYSTDNIKSASEWERQIRAGLKECDWFLIALSPRSVASEWVAREVHWAFLKRQGKIIPVMVETCEPEELHLGLLPLQFIDFRGDVAGARERLLAVWGLDKSTQAEARHRAAREALNKEDWTTAVEHLEAVLGLNPAHPQARDELNHARQRQELAALYDAGLTQLREKRWGEALETFRQVRRVDGNYKDVADSIALVSAELQKEEAARRYREALDAANREDWSAAVEQLQAVLDLNPSHAGAQEALGRAREQKELAELYAAGHEHLRGGRWHEALKSFRKVRALNRGYKDVADLIAEADAGLEQEEARQLGRERQEREAKEEAGRRARALAELRREALDAAGREDWAAAREKLQAARMISPDDRELDEELAEIDHRQDLDRAFNDGLSHFNAGLWADALVTFRQVQSALGDYKGVSALIAQAEAEIKRLEEQRELDRRTRSDREEAERRRRAEEEEQHQRAAAAADTAVGKLRRPIMSPRMAAVATVVSLSLLLIVVVFRPWAGRGDRSAESKSAVSIEGTQTPFSSPSPTELTSPGVTEAKPQRVIPGGGSDARPARQENTSRKAAETSVAPDEGQSDDEPPVPTPAPASAPKRTAPVSGGVLNGKVISKPQAAYPSVAKAARAGRGRRPDHG